MKITKFVHSCLLVEMPAPVNRTVVFDPGVYSEDALDVEALKYLDDVIITHDHADHLSVPLLKKLVSKFPDVRITAPAAATELLAKEGLHATSDSSEGITFFEAPHETMFPLGPKGAPTQNNGVHYLNKLSHPGDSHSFDETKTVLALPVTAPWGRMNDAVAIALKLKPKYVLPIHDWHWRDEARDWSYGRFEQVLADNSITFLKVETGVPVVLDV